MSDTTRISFSASLITQGNHRFWTLTMPSNVLAETCTVSTRTEDPIAGFQRSLDKKRAQEIADYIDSGLGTIPTSIILSAQEGTDFTYDSKAKTIEFNKKIGTFLIIDGQHRVYGFALAKDRLRVPVVIYSGLSRSEETKLFIDINTKQRPVPNELLLEIKNQANYESNNEQYLRDLFDRFNTDTSSPLFGLMSPSEKTKRKISRVTFNAAIKPLIDVLTNKPMIEAYSILVNYYRAVLDSLQSSKDGLDTIAIITTPLVFKAVSRLFLDIARKVKDKYNGEYDPIRFSEFLVPVFSSLQPAKLQQPGKSALDLYENMKLKLEKGFQL